MIFDLFLLLSHSQKELKNKKALKEIGVGGKADGIPKMP